MRKLDVIVPVYRGLAETKACLESAIGARNQIAFDLVIVNDASPEKALASFLTKFAKQHSVTLLTNQQNLGFAASCNRAMLLHPDRDVVLLNADTVVVDGWLDILAKAVTPEVASVTPFSNNASICSYPRMGQDNAVPAGFDLEQLNALFRAQNAGQSVEIPTCVGFCTLLTRASLEAVGLMNESAFGEGYGEENEWSVRASKQGFKHLLVGDLFIRHAGAVSFAGASAGKRLAAAARLRSLHADYDETIAEHINKDPQRVMRRRVDLARLGASVKPRIVLVTHNWGGGVERHVRDLVRLLENVCEVLVLRPGDGNSIAVNWANAGEDLQVFFAAASEFAVLVDFLSKVGVSRLHVHHIHGLPQEILTLAGRLGCEYDLTLHDHFPLTPQYHLAPGGALPTGAEPGAWGLSGEQWHTLMQGFLGGAARIICPSEYIASRVHAAFPEIAPLVWPHPERVQNRAKLVKVLALGRMNPGKGLGVLVNCAIDAAARKLPMMFKVLGPITDEAPLYPDLPLFVHGSYDDEDLVRLIALEHADAFIFPAQVPETYSYTMSAALQTGRPIIASDLGAFPERLRGVGSAKLLPWDSAPNRWNDALLEAAGVFPGARDEESLPEIDESYRARYLGTLPSAAKPYAQAASLRDAYFFPPRSLASAKEHTLAELYDAGVTFGQEESRRELRRRSRLAEREVAAAFAAAAAAREAEDEARRAAVQAAERAKHAEEQAQAAIRNAEEQAQAAKRDAAELAKVAEEKALVVTSAAEARAQDAQIKAEERRLTIEDLRRAADDYRRRGEDAHALAQDKQAQLAVAVAEMERARAAETQARTAAIEAERLAREMQEKAGAALAESVQARGAEAQARAQISELTARAETTQRDLNAASAAREQAQAAEQLARLAAEDARRVADAAQQAASQTREMMEQARFAEATARHAEIIARQTAEAARNAERVARDMADAANAAANQALEQLRSRSSELFELREVLQQSYNNYERLQELSDRAIADARREREEARTAFAEMQVRLEGERDETRETLRLARIQLEQERDNARAAMSDSRRILEQERDEAREAMIENRRVLETERDEAREAIGFTAQRLEEERDEARAAHVRIASSPFWKMTWPARKIVHALKSLVKPVDRLALESKRLQHRVAVAKTILQAEGAVALGKRVHEKLVGQADPFSVTPPQPACEQAQAPFSLPATRALKSTDAPDFSVIVPIYGQFEMTRNCLKSIADTCADLNIEVIVLDDCSPEDAASALSDIEGIRVVRNETNLGFLRTCNKAVGLSRGRYVVVLNNDTLVQPGWLTEMARLFSEHERVGMVGAKLLFEDGKLQEAGGIVWQDGSAWNWGRGQDPGRPEYNYVREVDYCSGACIMLERKIWDQLGGFDEEFVPAYYEDTDLAFRVRQAGLRVLYQPTAVVVHLEGKSSGTDVTQGVKQHQVTNGEKFKKRWEKVLLRHRANGIKPQLERDRYVKRRVLVVDACMLTPDQDSGSLRMFEMLGIMSRLGCKVTFFGDNLEYREPYVAQIQAMGVEVLFHPYHSYMKELLEEISSNYDVIMLSRVTVACKYVELIRKHAPKAKLIFDTVDLHFLRQERQAELSGDKAERESAAAMRKTELGVMDGSDLTLVVSPVEEKLLAEIAPRTRVGIVSNVHVNMPGARKFSDRAGVLFIGGFRHPPNLDAVTWYVEKVVPILRARNAGIVTTLIGSNAPPALQAFAADDIIIAGFVPDVTPFYHAARLSVSPLRYGAGVKGKVNLSMQYGVPVVATPMSAEGMYLADGENVLLADTPEAFADAVIRAHSDEALWNKLSAGGLENIEQFFSRACASKALSAALDL